MANFVNYGVNRDFIRPKRKFKWPENLNKPLIELKEIMKTAKRSGVQVFDFWETKISKQGLGCFFMEILCNCNTRLPDWLEDKTCRFKVFEWSRKEEESLVIAWSFEQTKYFF